MDLGMRDEGMEWFWEPFAQNCFPLLKLSTLGSSIAPVKPMKALF